VFASAANFPRPVIGGHHQPPNPLPSFAAPSPNWKGADPTAVQWVVVKVRFVLFAAAA